MKRRICAKSNKIILKAGVGLRSIVPQDGQDDRHVNDDPSSLRIEEVYKGPKNSEHQ